MMDPQIVLNWLGGLATLAITGFVSVIWARQEAFRADLVALRQELNDFKLKVAENHPTDADMREIRDSLLRIEAKLDLKADK
jgi:hypothetical protein